MTRRTAIRLRASCDALEERLCLAGSVGWDGPGRGSAALTYYVGASTGNLPRDVAVSAIRTALNAWASVARVTFTETRVPNLSRSLDITFAPIDGAGGTLARAYFPDDRVSGRLAGDIQFDSTDPWEVGNARGSAAFDLVLTAVHEIGHALGLDHSRVAGSVMAPAISSTQSFGGLSTSDQSAILSLYAPASSTSAKPPSNSEPTRRPPRRPRFPTPPRFRRNPVIEQTRGTDLRIEV